MIRKKLNKGLQYLAVLLLISLFSLVEHHLVHSKSDSVPYSFFWIPFSNRPVQKGDYATFSYSNWYIGKKVELVKEVACFKGDHILRTHLIARCNQDFLGFIIHKDSQGIKLPDLLLDEEMPTGKAFMYGSNPRSYDSRYFGLVSTSKLRRVIPLF